MNLNLNLSHKYSSEFQISKLALEFWFMCIPFLCTEANHIKFIPFLTEYSIDKLLLSQWYYAHNEILEKQENE